MYNLFLMGLRLLDKGDDDVHKLIEIAHEEYCTNYEVEQYYGIDNYINHFKFSIKFYYFVDSVSPRAKKPAVRYFLLYHINIQYSTFFSKINKY